MGLAPSDPKPAKITIREAYERIRGWYQTNISHVSDIDSRAKACLELVERLPEEGNLSDIEIRAVLLEVIAGKLEWAYHLSDGSYKMAAYATAALEQDGIPIFLSEEEQQKLKNSLLYKYLSLHLRN